MISLNEPQRRAAECAGRHCLVLAGAGSGKTRVITAKIAHLIDNIHVDPANILAITFTNKAAAEMRSRVYLALGGEKRSLHLRTFHSFGAFILRSFIHRLEGYTRNFSILDDADQRKTIKRILGADTKDSDVKSAASWIGLWKNELLYPEDGLTAAKNKNISRFNQMKDIYHRYQAELKKSDAVDFDDLIALPVRLMQKDIEVRNFITGRWRYVLVDEYQDTNFCQEQLLRIFHEAGSILTAVGDDDQSIYSFRGAQVENILNFPEIYNAEVVSLEENYRSTTCILDAANKLIANNPRVYSKKLFTRADAGQKPDLHTFSRDIEESAFVAESLVKLKGSQCAVFYRANWQSRLLEEGLINAGLAYKIIGGLKFFQRKEVKDTLAYAHLCINPRDRLALERAVNTPARGIGNVSLEKILTLADTENLDMISACEKSAGVLSGKAKKGCAAFTEIMQTLITASQIEGLRAFISKIIELSGIAEDIKSLEDSEEQGDRLENLAQLINAADEFESKHDKASLADFLEHTALLADADAVESDQNAVQLMTVHNAKGLEFDHVFVTGMEDGIFPHQMALDEGNEDEERRLCYVAITRAKKTLTLSAAQFRRKFGNMETSEVSRFLNEIGLDHLEHINHPGSDMPDDEGGHEYFY